MNRRADPEQRPYVYTVAQVAERLCLHRQTIQRLARERKLPMHRVGHQWLMTADAFDHLLDDDDGGGA